jgi:hypothetical protein
VRPYRASGQFTEFCEISHNTLVKRQGKWPLAEKGESMSGMRMDGASSRGMIQKNGETIKPHRITAMPMSIKAQC